MELALNELTNKALALPLGERTLLAQRLWESIEDFIDSDIEQEWFNVAEQRWKDIEVGSVQCIPVEEAMKTARAKLKRKM